jgi:hypothetical protein
VDGFLITAPLASWSIKPNSPNSLISVLFSDMLFVVKALKGFYLVGDDL